MKKLFSIVLLLTILSATHAQRYDVCRLSVGINGGGSSFTVSDQHLNGSSKMGTQAGRAAAATTSPMTRGSGRGEARDVINNEKWKKYLDIEKCCYICKLR